MERRIISTEINSEDEKIENHLRPQKLDEYIGQEASKEKLKVYMMRQKQEENLLTMCCFTVLLALARQHLPG